MERNSADIFASRLSDPNLELKTKLNIAIELRDNIETLCAGSGYALALPKLWPIFKQVLQGEPAFNSTSLEQKYRNCILETIHRLPMNNSEAVESLAEEIVDTLMELVRIENEDNAVLCMKAVMDLQRHHPRATRSRVQPFLDLIQEMFQMMDQVVKETFDTGAQGSTPGMPSTPSTGQTFQSPRPGSPASTIATDMSLGDLQGGHQLLRGMQSFKVLAECPIIVVSLFQAHRHSVSDNVKLFIPLIKSVLMAQAKPQEKEHAEAADKGKIFTGVSKEIKNRAAFGEFITAQVKTMSFLAYILRVHHEQLQDFLPILPGIVVRLLRDCPREKSSARKELLVAIRHIINFNFRKIFLKKIDELLDERTLIGDGLTVYETMRPLAYSMLADLIHHVRESLNRDQIRRTVEVYTKNLHDNFPGTSFQTMSAKLLLNMAESIMKLENKQDARHFLIMILDAIGDKFAAMNDMFPNAVKLSRQYNSLVHDASAENFMADPENPPDWDETDIFFATPIKTSNPRDRGADPVADNKFLFRNLVNGLKNLFYQLKACNPPGQNIDTTNAPLNWSEASYGYNAEEVKVITKLFREGARVFKYYGVDQDPLETTPGASPDSLASQAMAQLGREEKELLENFGTVFHCIDPATFHEVFQAEIPRLHELMLEHTQLLHLPQFFLASEATSPSFAGMVLQYLMEHIDDVGMSNGIQAAVLLRMFKLSFMSVTLFSNHNEQVLHPHITKIVTKAVQLSTTAREPLNYFLLLRSLFRSIGGGRFELLYKEILPLLEMLLETFNNLLLGARRPQDRDLYVELTLTVPARLSHLIPHLSYLMRPLVVALRAGGDIVNQGLRTLELCVDNLTADYLDPIMAPVMDDLMTALWEHLKPSPYNHFHAHTTMRILGKLGGRNRKFLNHPPDLSWKEFTDDESSIDVKLFGSTKERAFPVNIGLDLAIGKLMENPKSAIAKSSDAYYKQQAYRMLTSHLKLYVGLDNLPDDFAAALRLQASDLAEGKLNASVVDIFEKFDREKSIAQKGKQEEMLKKVVKACIYATTISCLSDAATKFVADVCRHFTMIEIGRALAQGIHNKKPFDVNSGEGPVYLDSRILADALVDSFSSDSAAVRDSATEALVVIRDTAGIVFGSKEPSVIGKLPFFSHLEKTFCHHCHEEEWYTKAGGSIGVHLLATTLDFGDAWLADRQMDFVRALMFVIKDTTQDLPASTRIRAQETLGILLRKCNKGISKEDMVKPPNKLYNLCGFFILELSHMNKHVRATAQEAFSIIAEVIGAEPHELIAPLKDRLLQPIFNKPLRALPFPVQIGCIEAITYCLGLKHDLISFTDQLNRPVLEALALADAEDESLAQKPSEFRNAEMIIALRVSCLKLLSMAMSFNEFANTPSSTSRARIIAVFFKSLYSKSPEIIDAANAGLKDVLTQTNKLPKDLLQNGLRPILMNLQDPKRLTVAGLDGLARLLTLLTNYFKVEIGSRLLDHMKTIADDSVLQKVSFHLVEQNQQMKIVAAIFNIFHLLPPAATSFMETLIEKVLYLESKLRRTQFSPFRKPLVKYLNRYPKESWAFFQARLHEQHGRLLAQLVTDPESEPLRQTIIADPEGLLKGSFECSDAAQWVPASINAIHVIHSVCLGSNATAWLQHESLRHNLLTAGKQLESKLRADQIPAEIRLGVEQAGDQMLETFTTYLKAAPRDIDLLFELMSALSQEELKPSPFMLKYLYTHVINNESVEYKRTIVLRCMDLYGHRGSPQKFKTYVFHNVVNPIFAQDVVNTWNKAAGGSRGSKLMDRAMTEAIHARLWRPQIGDISEESGQSGVDHSRMELLQLSTMLLKYHHNTVNEARKDIIKFAWNYIRLEDVINKYAAYVLISYFIAQYDTPSKIVIQIYVALLRAHQNEGKSLVTQALEILAPVLPKRISSGTSNASDPRYPMWAKWPRRILSEDSSNLQQIQSIFQFLVRQPDLFYDSRDNFVPLIVPNLAKIAQPPNPSNDSKKLALNLITLIWQWEQKRVKGLPSSRDPSSSKKRKLDDMQGASGSPSSTLAPPPLKDRPEYIIPVQFKMNIIKYLVSFIAGLQERYPVPAAQLSKLSPHRAQPAQMSNDMIKKAMQLLRDLLSPEYWGSLDIDLYPKYTEAILINDKANNPEEKFVTSMVNILQVVRVVLNVKNNEWITAHLPQIQKLLEKPLRCEHPEIQDCMHLFEDDLDINPRMLPPVKRVLDAMPEEREEEEDSMDVDASPSEFVTYLSAIGNETLQNGNYISGINILWTLSKVKPAKMDEHIPAVMKALQQKLAKDHVQAHAGMPQTAQAGGRPSDQPTGMPDAQELEIGVELILKSVDLISVRMATLGEQRRPFLSVLASLVEKSQNLRLCTKVLDMVEGWIFHSNESWPTLKEKTAVLQKMLLFEARPDQTLLRKFLDLVIRIYEDPKITRTELTVRLEHAFLIGTRAQDVDMRNRFMSIFDRSLTRSVNVRLHYVLVSQNWDTLAESFWLAQASQLIMGSIDMSSPARLHPDDMTLYPLSFLVSGQQKDSRKDKVIVDDELESLVANHRRFQQELSEIKVRDLLEPLGQLQHTDTNVAYELWKRLFPLCWTALVRDERLDLEKGMVTLLTREYHQRQIDRRPNVVQALLEGTVIARPRFKLPPHLMKFLSKTYDAWYTTAVALEESAIDPLINTPQVRESNLDALVEIYASLSEDDLFYGTWRRRCKLVETNAALSYEQQGMWDKAQQLYDLAQIKARTGSIPFSHAEYMLWEDHWVICAEKLQQWEILTDFAKHENFNDLLLEAAWRNFETWQHQEQREQLDSIIKSVSDAPTPRRVFFQAFMALLKMQQEQRPPLDFNKISDEAVQLSIRKWHQLPKRITNAHIPILQNFQQLVELHDSSVICSSLQQTNERNLDAKSAELKLLLGSWRDRLPNVWDDINAWQDLVTWRQHIFQMINTTYLGLLPPQTTNVASNSYAYRGYHETAWIINRFAHVARKHQLPEVCINQLSRIYTLPNIEIQEAFLKLREQAKCHYQNKAELNSGLDVINNTNLNYFGSQQKAEFFTLKGMFLGKLNKKPEANEAFGIALYYDLRLPKPWAEWGQYSDQLFKEEPGNLELANNAVSCYLEAAGLYKNAKSRKLLSRILWLLSLDDEEGNIAKAFDSFKGETPVWYWVTFIPQLLSSLSQKDARIAKAILSRIAKLYPQSLYFLLRTHREDMLTLKKQHDQKEEKLKRQKQQGNQANPGGASTQGSPENREGSSRPGTANGETTNATNGNANSGSPDPRPEANEDIKTESDEKKLGEEPLKKPWEYTDDIMNTLKTAFPLLALSMETMVDQIAKNFKCPADEDAYRLIVALLNDGLSYVNRMPTAYAPDVKLPPATEANITRFAETILPAHIRKSFEADFVVKKPTMVEYIHKLRRWRDRFEEKLDRRPLKASLESYSTSLSDFKFVKFDDVEVPGQYLRHKDKNSDFVRIERFMPTVELVRTIGVCHRRLKIRGHDGSVHAFAVQHPAARHCRREERMLQLFRIFNVTLSKRKESRRRNLNFHLPLMVPLAPHIRLVQDDDSYVTLQGAFEDYCRRNGMSKDDPVLFTMDKMRALTEVSAKRTHESGQALRLETFLAIQEKWVSNTVVLEYFQKIYPNFADFWLFRRQFSYQYAALTFMSYVMYMSNRYPSKTSISRTTGNIWGSELIPTLAGPKAIFHNQEPVPFRLTPNLQVLMGPLAMEGIFACAIMAIARCLTEPEHELENQLSLFVRDEMHHWCQQGHRANPPETQLREMVYHNSGLIVKRAISVAQPPEGNLPANQTLIDLISRAVEPLKLAQLDALWMPYL